MKIFLTVLVMIFLTEFISGQHLYDFKSGKVVYRLEGSVNGREVIFFDDYGKRFYQYKKTETATGKKVTELYIESNDSLFTYKTGDEKPVITPISPQKNPVPKNSITKEMLQKMGFLFKGKERAGNVLCDKYVSGDTILWIWNRIIIKSEIEIMDIHLKKEAVTIETGIDIPGKRFAFSRNNVFQFGKTENK